MKKPGVAPLNVGSLLFFFVARFLSWFRFCLNAQVAGGF